MSTPREIEAARFDELLRLQLGPQLLAAIADPAITDIMYNADGRLWCEAHGRGLYEAGFALPGSKVEALIGIVATSLGMVANRDHPIVEGVLPIERIRFEGVLPPVAARASFAMRKPSKVLYTFDDYIRDHILTAQQAGVFRDAVARKLNILIAGGTGSGKTTLAATLINEMAALSDPNDRYILLEDTPEIQCTAANLQTMWTSQTVDLTELVRISMRMRPTRILIGEVRGREALGFLKALLTGHPGGCCTVHAGSARGALDRLETLVQEAGVPPQPRLIAETINLIGFIEQTKGQRRVTELVRVLGYDSTHGFNLNEV